MRSVIKIKEINNITVCEPVVYISRGPGKNEAQCKGLCHGHAVSQQYIDYGKSDKDGQDGKDIFCIGALMKNPEDTAEVPDVDNGKEGGHLYFTKHRQAV